MARFHKERPVSDDARRLSDSEAEALVLGNILQSGEVAYSEVAFLTEDDFFIERNKFIFKTIVELAGDVDPAIDAVAERLVEVGKIEAVGGLSALMDLHRNGIPGMSLAGFARMLRRKNCDRRAYRLGSNLTKLLETGQSADSPQVLAIAEELREVHSGFAIDTSTRTFGECLKDAGGIDALCSPPKNVVPLAWSRSPAKGLRPGQLIVGAGRTGTGKTILGAQQAAYAAKSGIRTLFVSLEMSSDEMLRRFLSMVARVHHGDLQEGTLTEEERGKVHRAAAELDSWPLEIETNLRSIGSICSRIVRERTRGNPYRLAVIDYLQIIDVDKPCDNRVQEVSLISRALKACARENQTVVLALSQLSRAPDARLGDHEPRLSDLRDSGSIEQDADVVMFLHRLDFYKPNDPGLRNQTKLIVRKNRNGPIGSIDLVCVPQYVMLVEPND